MDRDSRAHYALPPDRLATARRKLKLAAAIQFTMPGSPHDLLRGRGRQAGV